MDRIETEHGIFTANLVTGQTAEEVYQEWLENKDKIGVCHEPTVEEKVIILEKTIANLEIELLEIK